MQLRWTSRALADLARLYDFLAVVNPLGGRQSGTVLSFRTYKIT